MFTFMTLGFLIGLQHALEADHIAAVASLASGDYANLRYAFDDRLHQPYRSGLVPGMINAMKAACDSGAIGSYMSGAGPSIMALIGGDGPAEPVASAMREAFAHARVNVVTMVLPMASLLYTSPSPRDS